MKFRARMPSQLECSSPAPGPVRAAAGWPLDRRAFLAAGLATMASCARRAPPPLTAFEGLVHAWGEYLLQADPEKANFLRLLPDGTNLTKLSERSSLAIEIARSQALRGLTNILAIERQSLRPREYPIFDVLLEHFARLEPVIDLGMGRFSQGDGPGPFVMDPHAAMIMILPATFAAIASVQDLSDAEDYLVLLSQCAKTIDAEAEHARADARAGWIAPPAALERIRAACLQLVSLPPGADPFIQPLRANLQAAGLLAVTAPGAASPQEPAPALSPAQTRAQALMAQAEAMVARDLYPAMTRTALQCESQSSTYRPPAPELIRKWLEAGLRYGTGDRIDLERTRAAALKQSKILTDQLDMSLRALGVIDGPVGQRLAQLAVDPRFDQSATPPEAILSAMNGHFASAKQQIPNWFSTGSFSVPDIRFSDPLLEISEEGMMYRPAGPRAEDRPLLTLDLARLRRKARFELASLAFSLGWPGRHAFASMTKSAKLPPVLLMIGFPAFIEGWCRYAEQLADEYGLHDSAPWHRIGYLQAQLRGCAALIADLDLSWRMIPRDEAVFALQANAGFSAQDAARAVDAMMTRPGAASAAEIGRSRIVAARDRARIGLGPDFDLRTFHGLILTGGELPLGVMDARIDAWIRSKQKSR